MAYEKQTIQLGMPEDNIVTKEYWEEVLAKIELANNTAQDELFRMSEIFDIQLIAVINQVLAEAQANLDAANAEDIIYDSELLSDVLDLTLERLDTAEGDISDLQAAVAGIGTPTHNSTLTNNTDPGSVDDFFFTATGATRAAAHHLLRSLYDISANPIPQYTAERRLDQILQALPVVMHGTSVTPPALRPRGDALRQGDIYVKY